MCTTLRNYYWILALLSLPFLGHAQTTITGAEYFWDTDPGEGSATAMVASDGTFDEAIEVANSTKFALTGGVFSRSPKHLEQARREFRVGNLYLNRGITGALVERQPFGGFKMSGVGSKAGGPDYLLQFMDPRSVTENTMRRGFAPVSDEDDWI